MENNKCFRCKYKPDSLIFSDFCKKIVKGYGGERLKTDHRFMNKDNRCPFYIPTLANKIVDKLSKIFGHKSRKRYD